MRQIDEFIDSVYQHFDGKKEEIKELKIEMKNHLLEAVHELKLEGKTETEAIKIAIERFGGEKEIRTVIGQLFEVQKQFTRWLLYCALFFLVFSILILGIITSIEKSNQNERHKINHDISMILSDGSTISKEKQDKIQSLIQGTNQVSKVEIYNIKNETDVFNYIDTAKPGFQYEREIWAPKTRFIDLYREGNGDDKWFIFLTYRSLDGLAVLSLLLGIAFSLPLFSIWGIINVYHRRSVIYKSLKSLLS